MSYIKGSPDHWQPDMTDTVIVYKKTGVDSYGKQTVSTTGTTYKCRVVSDIYKQTTDQKRLVYEEGRLIILGNPDVAVGDKILLANGNSPVVKSVDKPTYNNDGIVQPHHAVVGFGQA